MKDSFYVYGKFSTSFESIRERIIERDDICPYGFFSLKFKSFISVIELLEIS